MPPRILVFAGSNRTGAYSGKTADAAMKQLAMEGAEVTRIALIDYPMPIYDADFEKKNGVPENAVRLGRMIAAHDGVLIVTPEYNRSIPPLLKNTIDWLSRISRERGHDFKPFSGKIAALCSSSPGRLGGMSAITHLRPVCMHVGLEVITPQCSVANAASAFDADGMLSDERTQKIMEKVCRTLCQFAVLLSGRAEV